MNDSLDLRRSDHLHDHVALDEIELYAEVLIAVADADRPLSSAEIDRVLGLGGPSEPGDEKPEARRAWSTDPLPAGPRLPPTVLPAPREVPGLHPLWAAPLPLAPWYV
ncbi:hypothetical protein [Nocardiopsis halotolerans]|uniref:hypothetical protein n=1 Tax=Nocardiopsis halotolerans TaxID=124252 RepID=UPI00034D9E08|nr:hypothetical protein [Nocardiopsis halotolerans]